MKYRPIKKMNDSDKRRYEEIQEKKLDVWEKTCIQCGACCGVWDEDCCEHLILEKGQYTCRIYAQRFGLHKTKKGMPFKCVPIREILHNSWPGDQHCAYKKRFL